MKCPTCGCERFYIKDTDDEFEIYEFTVSNGRPKFDESLELQNSPQVTTATETFCDKCAWHGRFETLK